MKEGRKEGNGVKGSGGKHFQSDSKKRRKAKERRRKERKEQRKKEGV